MSTEAALPSNLIWALTALAQSCDKQIELYPTGVVVADELVSDFGFAFDEMAEELGSNSVPKDVKLIDDFIKSKSGILEYWTEEALRSFEFWEQIRRSSKQVLEDRGLSTFSPHPSTNTYVF